MQFQAVWVEIPVKDIERAAKFYGRVFGGAPKIHDDGVRRSATLTNTQGNGVGASLTQIEGFEPSDKGPLVYMLAADGDITAALAKVEPAGGKVTAPKTSMGAAGFYGLFQDTEGNVLAFYSDK